jgi:hypothetical protein
MGVPVFRQNRLDLGACRFARDSQSFGVKPHEIDALFRHVPSPDGEAGTIIQVPPLTALTETGQHNRDQSLSLITENPVAESRAGIAGD